MVRLLQFAFNNPFRIIFATSSDTKLDITDAYPRYLVLHIPASLDHIDEKNKNRKEISLTQEVFNVVL